MITLKYRGDTIKKWLLELCTCLVLGDLTNSTEDSSNCPGGALTGNLDPTNESTEISAKEDQQILALQFVEITEAPQFPFYKLVFSNPEYTLIE